MPEPTNLEKLEELYYHRTLIASSKKQAQDAVIPLDVAQELEAIDYEFGQKEEALAKKIQELEEA
jgi:hypothetical protein